MSISIKLFNKIRNELDTNITDSAIVRIVEECVDRTDMLGMDMENLLSSDVSVSFNNNTSEIDIRQNILFGIFWSFDSDTGELVGT